MITLKEIAEECGVSIATVSNILNGKKKTSEETKRRVMEVVKRTGYRPNVMAQGLRRQKSMMVGIIAEDIAQFTSPEIIEGIMKRCEDHGYHTIVRNLRLYARWSDTWYENESEYHMILDPVLQELETAMVDGIIYIAGHNRIIHCFPEGFPIPAVMAYGTASNPAVSSVLIDDEKAAYEIVRYIVSRGHKKIGVIAGRMDNLHTQARIKGYQRALFEAGLLFDPDSIAIGNWTKEGGYAAAGEIMSKGVTAVFCLNDQMAGGVYQYLHEKGIRAGGDFSVTGFDNMLPAEYMIPGLTTTALPLSEIGDRAAELLIARMTGEDKDSPSEPHRKVLVPCRFVERGSVAVCAG